VVAAVIVRNGAVLICQRRQSDNHPLKWEFPGGKVEPGESPPAALERELAEELDIRAAIGPQIERFEYAYPGRPPILLLFYLVQEFEGEPVNLAFEQIRWEPAGRLPGYDFLEADVHFVTRLASAPHILDP
jgi:mutator protein MutT